MHRQHIGSDCQTGQVRTFFFMRPHACEDSHVQSAVALRRKSCSVGGGWMGPEDCLPATEHFPPSVGVGPADHVAQVNVGRDCVLPSQYRGGGGGGGSS